MMRLIYIAIAGMLFIACKKEKAAALHNVQFSSNIDNSQYYILTINGTPNNDISGIYSLEGNSDIELKLFKAGGDTTSVDSRDSLWVRGGIMVDGEPVRTYAGYRDVTLSYHIE